MRWFAPIAVALLLVGGATLHATEVAPAPAAKRIPRPWAASKVTLPVDRAGQSGRAESAEGFTVKFDLSKQVLRVAAPKSEGWREPNELAVGDTVSVKSATTLSSGSNVLARLAKGQLLTLSEVQKDWVRANVPVGGAPKTGWVRRGDVQFVSEEVALLATLPPLAPDGVVSASLLTQKAKQFDDGLYAAVELAAQRGLGKFTGKAKLLSTLSEVLAKLDAGEVDTSVQVVLAARRLGGDKSPLPAPIERLVSQRLAQFMATPELSKPLAFYTWSDELTNIFRQDRMLQQPLESASGAERIVAALRADEKARTTYEAYLGLISRLTNPLSAPDLRASLKSPGDSAALSANVRFFPPSVSHETDLVKRLYGDRPIPEGFNLADELIKRIKAGEIDLTPREDSGSYDYQTWSMEPMVLPDKTPEAAHLQLDENYRKLLLELFKGALALARETHIKQLEVPLAASEAPDRDKPKPKLFVQPQLSAEPLATVYQRRAIGYRFVRKTLEETFGPDALASMFRLTAAGRVQPSLAEELPSMESLFAGAHVAVSAQLGMPIPETLPFGSVDGPKADAKRFLDWAANLDHDADVVQDARLMVPVFYDLQRKKTKAWAFLGWSMRPVEIAFAKAPETTVLDSSGKPAAKDAVEVHYHSLWTAMAYPVTAEVYVSQILNRDEFRRHCDLYKTQSAILRNLQ